MTELVAINQGPALPALIAQADDNARRRFLEFFAAHIRNSNTREAYARAVGQFLGWCSDQGASALEQITPMAVAGYVEELTRQRSAATVKQHLAALRMLFDWLVTGQVLPHNPAAAVRGPRVKYTQGKTPILDPEEAKALFASIPTDTHTGLRDRALIGVLLYSFARISAALAMDRADFYPQARSWWLRLHEKNGTEHALEAHSLIVAYLGAYIDVLPDSEPATPLFRTVDRRRAFTSNRLTRNDALKMIRRRAAAAGIATKITPHTFRATGITVFRKNGGTLEEAQEIAAHADPKTTRLYDRSREAVSRQVIEKIAL